MPTSSRRGPAPGGASASGRSPTSSRSTRPLGPSTVLSFRSSGAELAALRASGHPFFRPGWGDNVVGMVLDGATDWGEVAELLTESYCIMAPKKLAALVERRSAGTRRGRGRPDRLGPVLAPSPASGPRGRPGDGVLDQRDQHAEHRVGPPGRRTSRAGRRAPAPGRRAARLQRVGRRAVEHVDRDHERDAAVLEEVDGGEGVGRPPGVDAAPPPRPRPGRGRPT